MPPPNVVDPWLAGRRFGIVIDAGSSGSRLQIYSWKDPRLVNINLSDPLAHTLPKVDKGTRNGEEWVSKVEPGISSFADKPETVSTHLAPLLNHARDTVPPSLHAETPLFLLATAGMRLLTPEQQAKLLLETCLFLRHHSNFRIEGASEAGPCGTSVRIITGEEEGLFGWIAVNYLMDGFTGSSADRTTYGFLDMGGASTQIAFEPAKQHQGDGKNLVDVRLRLLGGEEIHHKVFVTTWLGYGTNQARERYVGKAITEFEATRTSTASKAKDSDVVPDPCLPKDLMLTESPVHTGPATPHAQKKHTLRGTGSFEQCMKQTAPLLNNTAPCPDTPCLMNGVHVPPIDFSVSHFIGVSEYWYSSDHVFGLGGPYDFVQYERAASRFCSREWNNIVHEHEQSRKQQPPSGDGEVTSPDGQVVAVGKWGKDVELSRLEMQCFKAAWVANVLHDGIGMPRIVDPGGNGTTHGDDVAAQAARKGLGRPTFQSVNTVGDIAISWTLGKMVLEASKEVPARSKATRPLVDPVDDAPNADSPLKPIRPFFNIDAFEDRISQHLPSSLHRDTLGFSPLLFLIYTTFVVFAVLLGYRLRRQVRTPCLRFIGRFRRSDAQQAYSMEEGKYVAGYGEVPASPSSKWFNPLRYALSASSGRVTPTRSQSMPNDLAQSLAISVSSTIYNNPMIISRTPSPSPTQLDSSISLNSLNRLSGNVRSRNASSMNLAGLATQHD
ncbi:hypothetical protein HGRIS_012680 [Hohenbuehelia grisea]|uniref:Apyrase n=1 Tax=Hohenbuehelia grisea TaxID=104357 RepID=A0ABR3IT54_9AGAR